MTPEIAIANQNQPRKPSQAPSKTTILAGFVALFVVYQLPQALMMRTGDIPLFVLATLAFVPVAYAVARWTTGTGWQAYFLSRHSARISWFPVFLAAGIGASALAGYISWRLGIYDITGWVPLRSVAALLVATWAVSFVASLSEDILTRAYLLRHLPLRGWSFVGVSATVFTLNHIYVLRRGPAMWTFVFALGLALALVLERTRSLWLTVAMHWGWNLVYHTSNTLMKTTETRNPSLNTWISATCAALLIGMAAVIVRFAGAQQVAVAERR